MERTPKHPKISHAQARVIGTMLASLVILLLVAGCGGSTGAEVTTTPSASPLSTYTDPSHGYSVAYDSALLAPVTKQSTIDSMRVYVMPGGDMGLVLMRRDAQSSSNITFLVCSWSSLGDYSYDRYLKILPSLLDVYAAYYKGANGKGNVISRLKKVDGMSALSYRFSEKAPNYGWLWGDSTMALTKKGWVQVVVVGKGRQPAPESRPLLEAAASLKL